MPYSASDRKAPGARTEIERRKSMKIRKADQPAFEEAASTALLSVAPQLEDLRKALRRAMDQVLVGNCPDHLLESVRRQVANEVGRKLFNGLFPPLLPPEG
jgi:hypothetical protein